MKTFKRFLKDLLGLHETNHKLRNTAFLCSLILRKVRRLEKEIQEMKR